MTTFIDRRTVLGASLSALALGIIIPMRARARQARPDAAPTPAQPPIEAYARSPLVDKISLSPDGKRVAMVSQHGDQKVLVSFEVSNSKPALLPLGPAKIRDLVWGDNDHVILVDSQTTALEGFVGHKHEFFLARCINVQTSKISTFFNNMDGFYGIVMGDINRVKIDGEYRVTASNYLMNSNGNLYLYTFSMDNPKGRLNCEASPDTRGFIVEPDGHAIAYWDFDDSRKTWTLNYNDGPPGHRTSYNQIYKVKDALDFPSVEGLGRDGKSLVIYFNKGEARGEYHEIAGDGTIGPALDTGTGYGLNTLLHPVTKRLAGFSHIDDWIVYDYFDPMLKKLAQSLPQAMGEDCRVRIVEYAEDPRKMIVYLESPEDAGSYYFLDFSTGNFQSLASNYADLPIEWITQKKPISYKAADGLEIRGYLTLPPFKKPEKLPLIVLPHGGPEARDYIDFDWQVQALASRGYAVLQPNFRGSAGFGVEFVEAGHGEFGRKMQTDLSDGVRDLVKQGIVDPKRVAILGASYGGYAALAGATLDPGVYNCAVSIAGVADPKSFIGFVADNAVAARDSSAVHYWQQFMGEPKGYDDISPTKQAAKASCPVLLIHGTDDTVVPIEQSQRMESALKKAGKPVEFVTYKGQDHWETVGSARIEMMKSALAFLDKHNPA